MPGVGGASRRARPGGRRPGSRPGRPGPGRSAAPSVGPPIGSRARPQSTRPRRGRRSPLSSLHGPWRRPPATSRSEGRRRRRPDARRRRHPVAARSSAARTFPGRVALRQGGSAANTARWLARLGARSTLVTAVGSRPGRPRAGGGPPVGRRDGPLRPRRRPADRPNRRRRHVRRRAIVRRRPRRGRRAPTGGPQARAGSQRDLLHVPAYSLIGAAARRRRPPRDRAGPCRGRARQPRPGVGGAAPREGPAGGPPPGRRRGAGHPLLDRRRGRGLPRRLRPDGPARVGAARDRQARRRRGDAPRPRRGRAAPLRGRDAAADRDRHDRRRRRVRRRVPDGLPGHAAGCSPATGRAPSRRAGRPPRGRAPAHDGIAGAIAAVARRGGLSPGDAGRTSRASDSSGRPAGPAGRRPGCCASPRGTARTRPRGRGRAAP